MQTDHTVRIPRPTALEVKGLFGHFNHLINLKTDSRVTLIAGPNGYGKTHLLKIFRAVLTLDLTTLSSMPFREATIYFEGEFLRFEQELGGESHGVVLSDRRGDRLEIGESELDDDSSRLPSWIVSLDHETWIDERGGRVLSSRDVERRFGVKVGGSRKAETLLKKHTWLARYVNLSSSPILIDTKRLETLPTRDEVERSRRAGQNTESTAGRITEYIDQVRRQIAMARRDSLLTQQTLEEGLARRLFDASRASIKAADVLSRYESLLQLNNELNANGLAARSMGVEPPKEMNPTERRIMNVVLENWERRIDPLLPVHEKLSALRRIVNRKLKRKSLEFDTDGSMKILSDSQEELQPAQLSSGEQHLIALFTALLFNSTAGSYVLIDEPEISLHASWQHEFVRDILEVAELSNLYLIMATHSTAIVNGRWDLVEELGDLEN